MPKSPIDWEYIRLRYEAGETPYAIAKSLHGRPSKQAIVNKLKAQGWQRRTNGLAVAAELPIVKRALAMSAPGKATPERVGFILELVGRGSSEQMAAEAAGINPRTLNRWKQEDSLLAEQLRQARAGKLAEWVGHIDAAAERDWKAAKELLQASRVEGFQQQSHAGVTVVLNIDRETALTIDGNST